MTLWVCFSVQECCSTKKAFVSSPNCSHQVIRTNLQPHQLQHGDFLWVSHFPAAYTSLWMKLRWGSVWYFSSGWTELKRTRQKASNVSLEVPCTRKKRNSNSEFIALIFKTVNTNLCTGRELQDCDRSDIEHKDCLFCFHWRGPGWNNRQKIYGFGGLIFSARLKVMPLQRSKCLCFVWCSPRPRRWSFERQWSDSGERLNVFFFGLRTCTSTRYLLWHT